MTWRLLEPGPWFSTKMLSYQYRKSHCGYRRSYERLISTTRFPILVRWHLYIDPGPRPHDLPKYSVLSTRLNMTPTIPDSKAHGANMEPIWGRQDPGGPHVGPMNFAIWEPIIMLVEPNLQRVHELMTQILKKYFAFTSRIIMPSGHAFAHVSRHM